MINDDFNTPVKGNADFIFNHEYGHHKDYMKLKKYLDDLWDDEFDRGHQQAKMYGSENKKYKNCHDMHDDEVIADVNGIIHTKNGNKVYKKFSQYANKSRHKVSKEIQQSLDLRKKNMEKDILRKKRSLSPHETDKMDSLNNRLYRLNCYYNNCSRKNNEHKDTEYYRAKSNLKAAKDPVLRNYMQ